MADGERRLAERVLEPGYAEDVGGRALADLRTMREECREVEMELSFERRLCQARIDILSADLERREGVRPDDDLIGRLPQILSVHSRPVDSSPGLPLPNRAPHFSIPRSADAPRRRLDDIVAEHRLTSLKDMSTEELKKLIDALAKHERNLSSRRKAVHEVLDLIQAEIVRRYTSGEADPAAALR